MSLVAIVAAASTPAAADPPTAALQAFAAGDYLAAASSAETQASPSSQLFAARALIAACMTAPHERDVDDWLDRAEDIAEDALRRDPNLVDARLQLAFVLGAKARRSSLGTAFTRNYAPRSRELIQGAIARAPNNAAAHALLGAWNLEVLRRGGAAGARFYGARLDAGLGEFQQALGLAPDDRLISVQFAVALLRLDATRYGDRIASLLAPSAAAPADPFEVYVEDAAARMLEALRANGPNAARDIAAGAFP